MLEITPLLHKRVLIFAGKNYEDLELWYPKLRFEEAGARVVLAGPEEGATYPGKNGYPCTTDAAIDSMVASDFHGVILPGGWMPDALRRDPKVLKLIREFDEAGKLVGAICHGGWLAISAGVYNGVRVTGSPGIKDDCINAGTLWEDSEVVIDRHFVSSRRPSDLPAFCRACIKVLTNADG